MRAKTRINQKRYLSVMVPKQTPGLFKSIPKSVIDVFRPVPFANWLTRSLPRTTKHDIFLIRDETIFSRYGR